jgi:hypothetical protein
MLTLEFRFYTICQKDVLPQDVKPHTNEYTQCDHASSQSSKALLPTAQARLWHHPPEGGRVHRVLHLPGWDGCQLVEGRRVVRRQQLRRADHPRRPRIKAVLTRQRQRLQSVQGTTGAQRQDESQTVRPICGRIQAAVTCQRQRLQRVHEKVQEVTGT